MPVFFPVAVVASSATVTVGTAATALADGYESAWSMMYRAAQQATQNSLGAYRLTVNESTSVLTLAGPGTFNLTISTGAAFTGFTTDTGAASYTSTAVGGTVVVDGIDVSGQPYSMTAGAPTADASAVTSGRLVTGSVTVRCAVAYAGAFAAARTLRNGVWDVVRNNETMARVRVTSCAIVPLGRLPGIVELEIIGQVVP
jgi:hypothetical protein